MVIGESRYFDLSPVGGGLLTGYSATYEIVSFDGTLITTGSVGKSIDNTKFEVRIQTTGMSAGGYWLRVFISASADNFVQAYSEQMVLTK